jgi:hypothetical protein
VMRSAEEVDECFQRMFWNFPPLIEITVENMGKILTGVMIGQLLVTIKIVSLIKVITKS